MDQEALFSEEAVVLLLLFGRQFCVAPREGAAGL